MENEKQIVEKTTTKKAASASEKKTATAKPKTETKTSESKEKIAKEKPATAKAKEATAKLKEKAEALKVKEKEVATKSAAKAKKPAKEVDATVVEAKESVIEVASLEEAKPVKLAKEKAQKSIVEAKTSTGVIASRPKKATKEKPEESQVSQPKPEAKKPTMPVVNKLQTGFRKPEHLKGQVVESVEFPATLQRPKQEKETIEVNPNSIERNMRKFREGLVVSDRMNKTIIVVIRDRAKHPLYKKTIIKTKRIKAHDENNECGIGDTVLISETRPISKDKHWRLVRIVEKAK